MGIYQGYYSNGQIIPESRRIPYLTENQMVYIIPTKKKKPSLEPINQESTKETVVNIKYDDDAKVWVAVSSHLALESESYDELFKLVESVTQDMINHKECPDFDSIKLVTENRQICIDKRSPIEIVTSTESHAELINGKIVVNERTSSEHNSTVLTIACEFMNKVGDKCKVFTQNFGLYCNEILGDDSNFFLPDIMVVDRDAKVDNEGVHSAPRFVAEVTSEESKEYDFTEKLAIYKEIGVKEYWIVDMTWKRIFRYLSDTNYVPEVYDYSDTSKLEPRTYPEVEIKLDDIFVVTEGEL